MTFSILNCFKRYCPLSPKPFYIRSFKEGKLQVLSRELVKALEDCNLCPRKCGVNRQQSRNGQCRTGGQAIVASFNKHFGEEPPLVGLGGSGTIFFAQCNLHCNFCQNFDISHYAAGKQVTADELAQIMLALQTAGAENINFVTPSHVIPQIISALEIAVEAGLSIPLVYNSSGYDDPEVLKKLEGVIDIYMPDLKFLDSHLANRTCSAKDYPKVVKLAVKEMFRQVGQLKTKTDGVAFRGLLIRHLVMPGYLKDTKEVLDFICNEVSPDTAVNIMPQYYPAGDLDKTPELNRRLSEGEYDEAVVYAREIGLTHLI